ncbi:unnamed protein product [Staurois parvus]|uniref:Uncharacterized protein n=1 Tax=Staurois parvus TaxID=386267 RepID=A0ABN9DSM8_9NEOB|nr:unnamed protein product [Staurois parvus]
MSCRPCHLATLPRSLNSLWQLVPPSASSSSSPVIGHRHCSSGKGTHAANDWRGDRAWRVGAEQQHEDQRRP